MSIKSIISRVYGGSSEFDDQEPNEVFAPEFSDQAIDGLCDLYSPEKTEEPHVRDLADVLMENQVINQSQYDEVRKKQMSKAL